MARDESDPKGWQALNEADMALAMMVLEELGNHVHMSIIDDAAIRSGILWQCACGWFNPANREHCQGSDDCPFTRDLSVVSDE